ncbi:hypothetical protein JB92DRAFT_3147859 [Gautieria morchelliformis]|nr:hypothetical protein JB92DRAFT_3147859 [Gautieria morchelliformis]
MTSRLSFSAVKYLHTHVAQVLSTVFGVQAKRVNVRSPQPLGEFMESLFVSPSSGSSSSKRRPSCTSLPPPSTHFTEGSDSTVPPPSASHLPRPRTELRTVDTWLAYLPQVIIISNLERASRAAQLALTEALRNRQIILDTTTWKFPEGFFVVYVSQVGDGYERPAIHTTLLDHFAFSITLAQTATPMPTSSSSPRISSLPNFF